MRVIALVAALGAAISAAAAPAAQAPDRRLPRALVLPTAPAGLFGLFPESRVTHFTPWAITEESAGLPHAVFPAYIGSGLVGIGLDASGMQNVDCRLAEGPRWTGVSFEHKDDLYVFHERMIAGHITPRNLMPLARLEYELTVDGARIAAESLPGAVTAWRRVVDLRRARVQTALVLRQGIRLTVHAFCPHEGAQACFRFAVASSDGRRHRVTLTARAALTLRARNGGGPIAERAERQWTLPGAAFAAGALDRGGPRQAWEDYALTWGAAGAGDGAAAARDGAVEVTYRLEAGPRERVRDAAFWFGSSAAGTQSAEAASTWAARWRSAGWAGAVRRHERDWRNWYAAGADVQTGDALRDLLFHSSLYLLRVGSTYRAGTPLQFLLFHPENWYGCTFWDLGFALDGLLRCNHLEPARRSAAWLQGVMSPDGRPFHWMTRYDGTSGLPPGSVDTGFMVSAAHATAALRLYEATGDRRLLREAVYPVVRRVAQYAVADRLVREGGHWIGAGAGLDVNTPAEVNDTYSAAWFGAVLLKAAEYAEALGLDQAERRVWAEAAAGLRLERGADGYHQSRSAPRPGGWVSMLLYPTEAAPLIDLQAFRRSRAVQSFQYDYHVYQPWVYFWQALSDLRLGEREAERADMHIAEGLKAVFGPGYLAEIVPRDMEGLPPYLSAHGAYLTAVTEQLVAGSVWNDTVRVFVHLPERLRDRTVRFERIRTSRGVLVSGEWTPRRVRVRLRAVRPVQLRLRVPAGATAVAVGGRRATSAVEDGGVVELRLPAGRTVHVEASVPRAARPVARGRP